MDSKNFGYLNISKSLKITQLDNNLEYLGLFIYLSMYGQFEDKTIMIKGQEIELKKGQTLFFQKHLSEKFGISIGKINKMLFRLKKYGLCEIKNTNKYSLFEPLKDFIFDVSGKQNENKMKTKGNNINNINNNNKKYIYIQKDFEDYYFEITGKSEKLFLDPKIDFETFKTSFKNYYDIYNSKKTYYSIDFSLNQFISDSKHANKFLTAKIEHFIDFSKKDLIDDQIKKDLRKKQIENENLKEIEEKNKSELKAKKIKDIIDSLTEEKKNDIENLVRIDILKRKIPIVTTAIFRAFFNDFIYKNYIINKIDNIDK